MWVAIGCRPAGSSSRTETSRSPKTVIATVRGMGVAVITSRCGGRPALSRSRSRCSTPKRCCSSTTTSPRSANWTTSESRAWVPMTIPASPDAIRSRARLRAAAPMDPVSSTTCVPSGSPPSRPACASGPRERTTEPWCWAASTSVGASSAACAPESTTCSIARRATSVLPEPTSPWSSRFMGRVPASSAASSSPTVRCPAVSSKGSPASNRASTPAGTPGRAVVGWAASSARRRARAHWSRNASW